MTIQSLVTRNQYVGNGITQQFFYHFRIIDADDIIVILRENDVETKAILGTDYTITGVNLDGGGSIMFNDAPAAGVIVSLVRDAKSIQPETYVENDSFPASSHELALDRATTNIQTIYDRTDLSLKLPVSTNVTKIDTTLGFIDKSVAGYVIAVNEDGDGFTYSPDAGGVVPENVVTNENPSTDMAVVRFDGTSGLEIQNSKVSINNDGDLLLNEPLSLISFLSNNGKTSTISASNNQFKNINYKLPVEDGQPGYVLSTDGAGNLLWTQNEGPPVDPDSLASRTDVFIGTANDNDILGSLNGTFWVPFKEDVEYQEFNAAISLTDENETRDAEIDMSGNLFKNAVSQTIDEVTDEIQTEGLSVTANVFTLEHDSNMTLTFDNVLASHEYFQFVIIRQKDDSATVRSLAFNNVKWPGGIAPSLTQTPEAIDILLFKTIDGGTNWFGFKAGGNFE